MPEIERLRKKPLVIEVLLWDGTNFAQIVEFTGSDGNADRVGPGELKVWNEQENDWIGVPLGHYVAKGVLGEFYPLSPEAYERTYDPAGAGEVEWAVFWGGTSPDDCAGWYITDQASAEEDMQWCVSGRVARRPVFRGPWEVVAASDDDDGILADAATMDSDLAESLPGSGIRTGNG